MATIQNRRHFLKSCVAASSATLLSHPALAYFESKAGTDYVYSVLAKHYGIGEEQRTLVPAYLARLKTPGLHTEAPRVFQDWLEKRGDFAGNLEAYLVEEFVVASNYFEVKSGREDRLRILPLSTSVAVS